MRFLEKAKDGGPNSPVDAFILFEIKSFMTIALLKFNKGARDNYHSHAFNALTWFIKGNLWEKFLSQPDYRYRRGLMPKITRRLDVHRVMALSDSWCFTIRGPWNDTWYEISADRKHVTILQEGREIVHYT